MQLIDQIIECNKMGIGVTFTQLVEEAMEGELKVRLYEYATDRNFQFTVPPKYRNDEDLHEMFTQAIYRLRAYEK